jgi:hypothetical protein
MSAAVEPGESDELRFRLGKVCGMLGSEHDGERRNALTMLGHQLANAGLSWAWFADLVAHGVMPGGDRTRLFHRLVGARLADGLKYAHAMEPSEASYVRGMAKRSPEELERAETKFVEHALQICDEARRRADPPGRRAR